MKRTIKIFIAFVGLADRFYREVILSWY